MRISAGRLAGSVRAGGAVTVTFAVAAVIMGAMAVSAVAVGLDGSGTVVGFTVRLAIVALLALASTTGLTIAVSHRDSAAHVQADS
jgi:hypothetical protein